MIRVPLLTSALLFLSLELACSEDRIDYARQIRPLLKNRCWSCHGGLKQEAGLRLDTGSLARKGGDNGPVIKTGQPDQSALIERVSALDESVRMPPEGKPLTATEIELVRKWIAQGATSPKDEQPQKDPRTHWAFQPPAKTNIPPAAWQSQRDGESVRNPIDAFLAARHLEAGLQPLPAAPPHILLRRVYLDLTGLPPTPEQLKQFLADESPTAWQRVVDQLLDDPTYGERWGRHWMDVWRYSDWYGRRRVNDVRNSHPEIWRWRDWIVNSLNKDTGYDEMLRLMLAADELDPENDENIVALGFIVRNWFSLNYDTWMQDQVEHTGKAFLGLRLNCAHCHDHKYDPITQEEYFRFRAFFEPLHLRQDRVAGGPDIPKYARYVPGSGASLSPIGSAIARVYDEYLDAETKMYRLGDARDLFDRPPVTPGGPAILGGHQLEITAIDLPAKAWYPGLKDFVRDEGIATREEAITTAETNLKAARETLAKDEPHLLANAKESDAKLASVKKKLSGEKRLSRALAGEHSLVMDGGTGRCCLTNTLPGISTLDDGTTLTYRLKLQTDTWSAMGLVLNINTGHTGGYVAFRKGQIATYRAGGKHAEFGAGYYDFENGQSSFEIKLELQTSKDQALLTVVALGAATEAAEDANSNTILVNAVPTALHGWNRAKNAAHVLSFDARSGALAVLDSFRLEAPDGTVLYESGFEDPDFVEGQDVAGKQGWHASKWTVAPGKSVVSRLIESSPELKQAQQNNLIVRRGLDAARMKVKANQKRLEAVRQDLNAFRVRVESERRKFLNKAGEADSAGILDVVVADRTARAMLAEATKLEALVEQYQAEARPLTDEKRTTAVQAAQKKVAAADTAFATATQALNKIDDKSTITPLGPTYHKTSTGRRSALAKWMTDPANPLPARVAINHIWLRHFGRPLVESVLDFGNSGAEPTHPKLLDWLAVEFIESGWSMKHIHRQIVTSQAYRMRSNADREVGNAALDSGNRLLWKFNGRRLEAEAIRDSILSVSGLLDRTRGGPVVDPKNEATSHRRSLYFEVYPEDGGMMKFMQAFDAPDPCDCYRRTETVMPQQALALNNSQLIQSASRRLATAIHQELPAGIDPTESSNRLVTLAFERCLSRQCSKQEQKLGMEFFARQMELYGKNGDLKTRRERALASLIRVLFSHSDFVTLR